ncbi:hypothetical protein CYMTET_46344 [Cymbomonas tetramitiformis]|uniref:Uncharacterized protein n=1 Tax=Cymbomonas tetramitiformis TaxID=36881 RepID=A0AAE0EYT0_9CHLO|nr:hypothetical protein CYMTET_46344 [Cymbomonas tetramitiformis]
MVAVVPSRSHGNRLETGVLHFGGQGFVTEESGSSRGMQFKVSIEAPATLWCAQALASRNASLDGDFLGMTLSAFFRRSGYTAKYTSRVSDDLFIEQAWTLS